MKLIFIRHGDPNYKLDTLTEKGWKEAELLSKRVAKWDVKQFYCSSMGRAQDTAGVTLKKIGREAITYDWLREFIVPIQEPVYGGDHIPWDLLPGYWTKEPLLYDKDEWVNAPVMKTGDVANEYQKVCTGIDTLIEEHGYKREGSIYRAVHRNEDTIVFFCHLGVTFLMMSHLLGISAPCIWQGFFVAPTSVTVLQTEERREGEVCFRCQMFGDVSHLYVADETPSTAGTFQEIYTTEQITNVKP